MEQKICTLVQEQRIVIIFGGSDTCWNEDNNAGDNFLSELESVIASRKADKENQQSYSYTPASGRYGYWHPV